MTPAAIRETEGPALDAFVLERVCGVQWEAGRCGVCGWPLADTLAAGCVPGCCSQRPLPARRADAPVPISTDNAACWQWVVPALIAKKWRVRLASCGANGCGWHAVVEALHGEDREYQAEAPTPALAIVRAAALTVAEGGE